MRFLIAALLLYALPAERSSVPLGLDLYMPVPEENPMTIEKIELGRRLFNDRRLSRDESTACITCHAPERAFSDPRPIAVGVFGRVGRRHAPALINRGYGRAFFWDARSASLEDQVLKPIRDPNEMDLTIDEASSRVGLDATTMAQALASYVRSILSGDAPYDRFINGDRAALSPEQQTGLQIFRGKGNCTACHVGPTLTDERLHNTGVAWRDGRLHDEGRFAVSRRSEDRGAFKTPTLREVGRSAPYMHDGSLTTLADVVQFYDEGGRVNPNRDAEIRPLHLTASEKEALIAFLHTLSGTVSEGVDPRSREFFERVEYFQPRTSEVPVVAGGDREFVASGGCSNVAVFDRHTLAGFAEKPLLLRPHVGDRDVEPVNPPLHGVHQACQPGLKRLALPAVFGAHPVGQLGDDHGARVAPVLLPFEPGRDSNVTNPLGRLADDVGVEQPAHSLRRRAGARRRGGTSSALTGQALSTASQSSLPASRRNTRVSSSASKRASK